MVAISGKPDLKADIMQPIKNKETEQLCVDLAALIKQGQTMQASDKLRDYLAPRKLVRWEILAIQDRARYLAKQ